MATLSLLLALAPACFDPSGDPAARIEEARAKGLLHGAVLVARGDEVVHRSASGLADPATGKANDPETRFQIASLTKLLTKAVVLRLVHAGLVDLDLAVGEYVPGLAPHLAERITVRHLLEMRSGLPRELGDDPRDSGVALDADGRVLPFLATLGELPLAFEPGSSSAYSNVGYWLLGGVVEGATGMSFEEALEEHLTGPLGMQATGLRRVEGKGVTYARSVEAVDYERRYTSGGCASTVDDLFRLTRALPDEELFGADGVASLLGEERRVLAAGHLPGFTNVLVYDDSTGRTAIALNNVAVEPPDALLALVRRLAGQETVTRVLEVKSADGGLPDTAIGRAGTFFVEAVGRAHAEQDPAPVAAWLREHTNMDASDDNVQGLLDLPPELDGWDLAGYAERGPEEIFLVLRGDGRREARITLVAVPGKPDVVDDVRIDIAPRGN